MLICGHQSIVDVTTSELVPAEDGPSVPVEFKVHVESYGFTTTRLIRIEQSDVRAFVSQLRAVERVRQAAATLSATPSDALELRVGFGPDSSRPTVSGRLIATEAGENAAVFGFAFDFDPATLPVIVAEAERWIAPARQALYLCQLGDLMDGMDDERAGQQFSLLGSILDKLGYQLASGLPDQLDQLWALKKDDDAAGETAVASEELRPGRDERAIAFERQFLAWLHIRFGLLPEPRWGANAQWWTFEYENVPVSFVIIGQSKNGSLPPPPGVDWLLRVEEPDPCTFIERVQAHFEPGSARRRRMSTGRIRVQFKSTALCQPFVDQTDTT